MITSTPTKLLAPGNPAAVAERPTGMGHHQHRHSRPIAVVSLALAATISLAACGDDQAAPSASSTPASGAPGTTNPDTNESAVFEHPTGADEIVVSIGYEGGFVPADYGFRNLPTVLLSGNGRAFTQGPVPEIYPGPLLPNVLVRSVTEAGTQSLLQLANKYGLLADVEYVNPTDIADAPDTVVTIAANGATYTHRAYALGIGGDGTESDPQRQALADFVNAATGDWLYGDNPELGTEQPFASDTYLIWAIEVGDMQPTDIEPTVVDWPADASVRLVDAGECAAVPAAEVGALFAAATQLTYFAEGGVTYQLAVKPQLPGDSC